MATDPYESGQLVTPPFVSKEVVTGTICAVLSQTLDNRGLELIVQPSRVVRAGDVHELLLTDERAGRPGHRVDRICGIAFFVVARSGVILRGDRVTVNDKLIGAVLGFDESHAPNHLNIVLGAEQRKTGEELHLALGMTLEILFRAPTEVAGDGTTIPWESSAHR